MPTKTGKPPSSYYKNDLTINQSTNTGIDSTTRVVHDGAGQSASISLSDDVLSVQPVNDDTTGAFLVKNKGGSNILAVDTTVASSGGAKVLIGASQVAANTQFKEMGLFDFSPSASTHNPLISNNMMGSDAGGLIAEDASMFGIGTDPATTLDISADGTPMFAIACYWYLDNDIRLDSVRYMAATEGTDTLEFHIMSYSLDTSSNPGDLSDGTLHAYIHSVSSATSKVLSGALTINTANIDAGRVVIGFVESDSTTDVTCTLNLKYHII